MEAFVEDLALWFEHSGVPRMAGRVLGWLLVCDPPEQSAEALAGALQASRGSISTATRLLTTAGLVERVSLPGDRRTYYRARSNWSNLLDIQLQRVTELRALLEKGLDALGEEPPARRQRLDEVHSFAAFWQDELEQVLHKRRTTGAQP